MATACALPGTTDIPSSQGGTMKKERQDHPSVRGRPRGVRSVRPRGDHRLATPSTQIWIPSTDIQPYKTVHLELRLVHPDGEGTQLPTSDISASRRRQPPAPVRLRADRRRAAIPEDPGGGRLRLIYGGRTPLQTGQVSIYFNFKIGMPEDNTWIPAVAVGMYGIGTKTGMSTTASTRRPARTRTSTTASSPRRFPS